MKPAMISASAAAMIASQWGSYMTAGDPGAVFYSLMANDARPEDADHRAALIAYTDDLLANFPAAADDMSDEELADFAALTALRDFFVRAPYLDGSPAPAA